MSEDLDKVIQAVHSSNTAQALQQLNNAYHTQLAEALLIAVARAKTLDGHYVHVPIPFELLPSICRALEEELKRIGWGQ